jgi:tripartite-type tricarboxylate transporter receptor subunit TctC
MNAIRKAICAISVCLASISQPLYAQNYPSKVITIVVPFAPGGGHDATARAIASRLSTKMGQQVVVLNKPGANAMIGAEFVARSAPDGYTIMLGSPAETVISPYLYKDMKYAPMKDLAPITLAATTPIALVAHPSLGVSTLPELIALAKREPGKLSYGSPGTGSAHHLVVEWIKMLTKIDLLHVPYKGAAPATVDAVGGQISLASVGMAPATPHIASKKLKVLAAFNQSPLPWDPSIKMANEIPGLEDVVMMQWMGVFAPAHTPPVILDRLNAEIGAIVKEPAMKASLIKVGVDPVGNSRQEFETFLKNEDRKFSKLVAATRVTID